jgi:hypothetical protein
LFICLPLHAEEGNIAPYICYASVFERLGMSTINTSVREITTEEQPPGFEEIHPSQALLFGITRFRPSRFDEGESVITKNITIAVCRQKVHNEVMKELSVLFSDSLDKCFTSWYPSKQKESLNLVDDRTVVQYKRRKFSNVVSRLTGDQTSSRSLNDLVESTVRKTKANYQPTIQPSLPKQVSKRKRSEVEGSSCANKSRKEKKKLKPESSSHARKSRKDVVTTEKKRKAPLIEVKKISAVNKVPSRVERTQAVVKKMTSSSSKSAQKGKHMDYLNFPFKSLCYLYFAS